MTLASLAQFAFIIIVPIVAVAGAVVTLLALGALFDVLDNPDETASRVQALFRQPLAAPITPGRESYYKAYWAR